MYAAACSIVHVVARRMYNLPASLLPGYRCSNCQVTRRLSLGSSKGEWKKNTETKTVCWALAHFTLHYAGRLAPDAGLVRPLNIVWAILRRRYFHHNLALAVDDKLKTCLVICTVYRSIVIPSLLLVSMHSKV